MHVAVHSGVKSTLADSATCAPNATPSFLEKLRDIAESLFPLDSSLESLLPNMRGFILAGALSSLVRGFTLADLAFDLRCGLAS